MIYELCNCCVCHVLGRHHAIGDGHRFGVYRAKAYWWPLAQSLVQGLSASLPHAVKAVASEARHWRFHRRCKMSLAGYGQATSERPPLQRTSSPKEDSWREMEHRGRARHRLFPITPSVVAVLHRLEHAEQRQIAGLVDPALCCQAAFRRTSF